MSSSRLEGFSRTWAKKEKLTADSHWEEITDYMHEIHQKKQRARENARTYLEALYNQDLTPAKFDDEARKIKENLDAAIESIDKEGIDIIRGIEETQRKERGDHKKAYHEALAARRFMNDLSPNHLASPVFASTSSEPPYGDPTNSGTPPATAPGEKDQPAVPEHFSCAVQREFTTNGTEQYILKYKTENRKALQRIVERQADPSRTSVTTPSIPGNKPGPSRSITFDEVYQNGEAKHKDTIIEFPPLSRQWYIIKCEEHEMRFGQRPLAGAAKHLNGRLHGGLEKSWHVAVEMLGYRVIDCTEELAALNNKVVVEAFAHGYKPVSMINPERKIRRKQNSETITDAIRGTPQSARHGTDAVDTLRKGSEISQTSIGHKSTRSPPEKRRKGLGEKPAEIITNPKTFHVYNCFWKDHDRLYPVMILAWDDQKPGGLEHDLAETGLLDKKSNPPNCYIYKDTDSGKNKAIAGWATGFEDGGSKVNQRKFPAMFFPDKAVSWVSASLLSKFPLFKPDPPNKKSHPFNVARRWIAKNEGFSSWEEFEQARKDEAREKREQLIMTPSVSPLSDMDDTKSDPGTESSAESYTSHTTEKVLQELQDKAGEIPGDSDYAGSDVDSTLEDELEEWEQTETDGRPWAWYDLRQKTQTTPPQEMELSTPTPENTPSNNKAMLCVEEGMRIARRPSVHARTQDDDNLAKDVPDAGTSYPEDLPKETIENSTYNDNDKPLRNTPVTNVFAADVVNQATPPLERPISRDTTGDDENSRVEGDFRAISCMPAGQLYRPSSSPAEPESLPKGMKRARSKEGAETDNNTSIQGSAKKPKQTVEITTNQATMSTDSGPLAVVPPFKPKEPLGPAVFELSSYSKGVISWNRQSEEISLRLYYGEGDRMVGTVDGPVDVIIDPTTLRGIMREEIPQSKGNVVITLLSKDPGDASVKVVFDRPVGSKVDIGKVQSRNFLRWIRRIVPTLPLLEG